MSNDRNLMRYEPSLDELFPTPEAKHAYEEACDALTAKRRVASSDGPHPKPAQAPSRPRVSQAAIEFVDTTSNVYIFGCVGAIVLGGVASLALGGVSNTVAAAVVGGIVGGAMGLFF